MSASGKRQGTSASIWRGLSGATVNSLEGGLNDIDHAVLEDPVPGPQWPEEALFHLINGAARDGCSVLITSRAGRRPWLAAGGSEIAAWPINLLVLTDPMTRLRRLLENIWDRHLRRSRSGVGLHGQPHGAKLSGVTDNRGGDGPSVTGNATKSTLPLAQIMTEFSEGIIRANRPSHGAFRRGEDRCWILNCRQDRSRLCVEQGLGYGCADALAAVGVNLVMNARTESTLAEAAESIRNKRRVGDEVVRDIQRTKAVRRCWKRPAMWIFW